MKKFIAVARMLYQGWPAQKFFTATLCIFFATILYAAYYRKKMFNKLKMIIKLSYKRESCIRLTHKSALTQFTYVSAYKGKHTTI